MDHGYVLRPAALFACLLAIVFGPVSGYAIGIDISTGECANSSGLLSNHGDSAVALVQTNSMVIRGGSERTQDEGAMELRRRMVEAAMYIGCGMMCLYLAVRHAAARAKQGSDKATHQVLELMTSFIGLVMAFGAYSILQEFIMTQKYGEHLFPSAAFLMWANRVVIIVVSAGSLLLMGEPLSWSALRWAAIPAVTNSISSWCQHSSLRFITFPTQTVFKNSKIVPTMLMNRVMNGQTHTWQEYCAALVVSGCVISFSLVSKDVGIAGDFQMHTSVGVVLMVVFIVCDALTSTGEKRIYRAYPGFSNMQMMLSVATFSLFYSTLIVHFTVGFSTVFGFLALHPEAFLDLGCLAVCSTIGQYLTYHIIRRHGPVTLSIMMTVRQVLSIYISAMLFEHRMGWLANCCICMCVVAIMAKPLLMGKSFFDTLAIEGITGRATIFDKLRCDKMGQSDSLVPTEEVNEADEYGTFNAKP